VADRSIGVLFERSIFLIFGSLGVRIPASGSGGAAKGNPMSASPPLFAEALPLMPLSRSNATLGCIRYRAVSFLSKMRVRKTPDVLKEVAGSRVAGEEPHKLSL
jgi:hypothetical protein